MFTVTDRYITCSMKGNPDSGIRIPESGKYLLEESGIQGNFAGRIQNPGLWNPEFQ